MLGLSRHILTRIRSQVPGFKTVGNASLLAPIPYSQDIGKLLPACIVSPGPGDLASVMPDSLLGIEDQEWDVGVMIGYNHDDDQLGIAELEASKLMDNIYRALHNWRVDTGEMRSGFIYKGRYEPVYNIGWALFPMTFSAKAVIGREEDCYGN